MEIDGILFFRDTLQSKTHYNITLTKLDMSVKQKGFYDHILGGLSNTEKQVLKSNFDQAQSDLNE